MHFSLNVQMAAPARLESCNEQGIQITTDAVNHRLCLTILLTQRLEPIRIHNGGGLGA